MHYERAVFALPPICSPRSAATRSATDMALMRRGCATTMFTCAPVSPCRAQQKMDSKHQNIRRVELKLSIGSGIESKLHDQSERSNQSQTTDCTRYTKGAVSLSTNHVASYERHRWCLH